MDYIVLNSHIVSLSEIRDAYKYFDSIYIDFKNGDTKTLIIKYTDISNRNEDFDLLIKFLMNPKN